MTYNEWYSEHGDEVEREWHFIHDEYGDLAPLLSQFKEQRYREFLETNVDKATVNS